MTRSRKPLPPKGKAANAAADPRTALDAREREFVRLVFGGMHAAQAYRQAGYKVTTKGAAQANASRKLWSAKIQAAIQAMTDEQAKALKLSPKLVLLKLWQEANGGGPKGRHTSQAARIRALELIGKQMRMFGDRLTVEQKDGGPLPVNLEEYTADELASLIALLDKAPAHGGPGEDGGGSPALPAEVLGVLPPRVDDGDEGADP